MKKNLIVGLILILASRFGVANTELEISPTLPSPCAWRDSSAVSIAYAMSKTGETVDTVEFTILMQEGQCLAKQFISRSITPAYSEIGIIENNDFWSGFRAAPATIANEFLANDVVRTKIVFNKKQIFKDDQPAMRKYLIRFTPDVQTNKLYSWNAVLTQTLDPSFGPRVDMTMGTGF